MHATAQTAGTALIATPPAPQGATAAPELAPNYAAIRINDQPASDNTLLLRPANGTEQFYLSATDAKAFRLALTRHSTTILFEQEPYFPLHRIPGIGLRFDDITQTLSITAGAQFFDSESIGMAVTERPVATIPALGSFFSYDLSTQRTSQGSQSAFSGGQFEWGVFTPHGVLTNTMVATYTPSERKFVRLDSVFTIDNPDAMASWRIGDGVTRTATWGSPARFSGVQYSTNFGTQPTVVTYPLNSITGETTLPSVVDIYINNVLSATQRVQPGSFTLNDLPAMSGQGEIRLVVRDLLGRERAIVKSLYGSTTLLKAGLNDVAFQAGSFRESYATRSAAYGRGFASALWRRGILDSLTFEGGLEVARGRHAAGAGANWLMGSLGEFSAAAAHSAQSESASAAIVAAPTLMLDRTLKGSPSPTALSGRSFAFGWSRRARGLSLGIQAKLASSGFRSLAGDSETAPTRREVSASASYPSRLGAFAVGYIAATSAANDRIEAVQFTWSKGFGDWGLFSVNGIASLRGSRSRTVALNYSLPFNVTSLASSTATTVETEGGRQNDVRFNLQKATPPGDGVGYRVDVTDKHRATVDLQAQNRVGVYAANVTRTTGVTGVRLGVGGSLVFLGGEVSLGRRVEDAFALVSVPGFENVRVYLDNQEVGKTNADGNLFVARLRPYQVNRLSIEQLDLAMSAEVAALKLDAMPFLKSGLIVRFAVKESLGGVARFIDEKGRAIPAGSVVTIASSDSIFPVAEGGEAFLTGLAATNRIRVTWQEKHCTIDFKYLRTDDPQPLLGPFVCQFDK